MMKINPFTLRRRNLGTKLNNWERLIAFLSLRGPGFTKVKLPRLGIHLPAGSAWSPRDYWTARRLNRYAGIQFTVRGGHVYAKTPQFEVAISNGEELFILHEVLVEGCYDFDVNAPYVVLDIGMNAGFSALYFAAKGATRVFGFEPIAETFMAAQRNLSSNTELGAKVDLFQKGIGETGRNQVIWYRSRLRGGAGFYGEPANSRKAEDPWKSETVAVISITDVVKDITARFPKHALVAKIDCEGSEFDIIAALQKKNQLGAFSYILMEWHEKLTGKDPSLLTSALKSAGFGVLRTRHEHGETGMIYAAKIANFWSNS